MSLSSLGSLKWVLLALVVVYLFRNRLFGAIGTKPVTVAPDPLYGPLKAPIYSTSPPTPAIGQPTNIYDTISTGITQGVGLLKDIF